MKNIFKLTTLFLITITLLISCTEKNNQKAIDKSPVVQEEVPKEETNIVVDIEEAEFSYETDDKKDKMGIIGKSTMTEGYDIELEEKYQCFPVCLIMSKPLIRNNEKYLKYSYDSKNPVLPKGPLEGKNGELIFYYEGEENNGYFKYFNKKWEFVESPLTAEKETDYSEYLPDHFSKDAYVAFELKDGILFEDLRNQDYAGIDLSDKTTPTIIHREDLNSWKAFTKAGFKIIDLKDESDSSKQDTGLYKDDMPWSVSKAYYTAISMDKKFRYVGKLFSGHNMFYNSESFLILDSTGTVVKQILIPWHMKKGTVLKRYAMAWKIGKYGEIYSLTGPEQKLIDKAENAELIVIKNHLESFGIVDVDSLVLYKESDDYSEALGYYPKNTGFVFLEKTITEENPIEDDFMYKVRLLDGTTGYFKGANIRSIPDVPQSAFPWR